jgi:hypothetical protein
MRCKKGHWPIPPVVIESGWSILRIELKDRQKFYGCDPETLKIRNLFDESKIGPPLFFSNT